MSQLYHYENIPERGTDCAWRCANEDDDVVASFADEPSAREFVAKHNQKVLAARPETWNYGSVCLNNLPHLLDIERWAGASSR